MGQRIQARSALLTVLPNANRATLGGRPIRTKTSVRVSLFTCKSEAMAKKLYQVKLTQVFFANSQEMSAHAITALCKPVLSVL